MSKSYQRPKGKLRFITDPRLFFCISAALLFFLVAPSQTGCYLNYWTTPWGRMSILFMAAVLLWVRWDITFLASMILSILAFSITTDYFYLAWDEFLIVAKFLFADSGVTGVVRYVWREVAVASFSLLVFTYGAMLLARKHVRRSYL
jgi:hypothetical protein